MNYGAFRFRAVVDWIEVQFQTEKTTNFQTVQRAFKEALCLPEGLNIWVKAHDANLGGGASVFSFRIHDVRCYLDIGRLLIKVGAKLDLKPGLQITEIELALDAYGDNTAGQAARFYKFMTHPVSNNRRMYHDHAGTVRSMPRTIEAITRHLSEGWQIGIGDKTDDRYQHIYVKTTDTRNGERQEVEQRARIEIRLSGEGLPCQMPDEWAAYRFEELARYFRFTKLKDGLEPLIQTTADAADQIGERKTRNRREGGTRLYSKATQADKVLNDKVRDALRKLSKRWKASSKQGRPARLPPAIGTTPEINACGNTGRINEQTPHECREETTNSNNYIYEPEQQQNRVTASDFQVMPDKTTRLNFDRSNESAKPIHTDHTNDAIEELIQQYEATPEAKKEHDRINKLMGEAVGGAGTPPLNIEVISSV